MQTSTVAILPHAVKISVTINHISAVMPPSLACGCPVSLAIQDSIAGIMKPTFVGLNGIALCRMNDPAIYKIPTPKIVQDFIVQFDKGLATEPFEFEIKVPWSEH